MHARPPMRRRLPAVLLVLLLVALGACTDDGADATAATSTTIPRPSTVVRIGVEDWPACVNPLTCRDDALHEQVLQHVLPVAFEIDATGAYVASAMLAERPILEVGEDGASIRYVIDPDARWADGRPITSSDFVGTWQAVMSTPGTDRLRWEDIVDVDDSDPTVAVVPLARPIVDWQELFGGASGYVLQADSFGPSTDLTGQFEDELPMAAGPYLLSSWDENGAVLSATEPWPGAEPPGIDQVRLDRVQIDSLGDPMTFDMLVPGADSTAQAPAGFDVRRTATTRVLGLWFDQREPSLQPLEQRQAFERLLDRSELAGLAGVGDVVTCAGWVPDLGPWCSTASVEPAEVDTDVAQYTLAALGWTRGGFGVLFRGDELLTVPITYDPALRGGEDVASAVSEALGAIGVETRLAETSTSTWADPARSLDASTGLGVFAVDLGTSPRVDQLYGCPGGPESSVVAACPDDITGPARSLAAQTPEEALSAVEALGTTVDASVLWLPLRVVPERSFVRPGRVVTAPASNAVGGPLAGLHRFDADV